MGRHLNLVENEFSNLEKRIFPRFPFCFVTFKSQGHRTFEVRDITNTGMQLLLKDGQHSFFTGQDIEGSLHWVKSNIRLKGKVQWTSEKRLGVAFSMPEEDLNPVKDLLTIQNLAVGLKPLHGNLCVAS
jgi:hypothetical protein